MKKGDRWAQIDPNDMHTIIDPKTGKADVTMWHKTLDAEKIKNSSVFEASSIKKINDGHYVFIYSSNERKSALTYCYSNNPQGPWSFGGEIIRNDLNWKGGNNHGSIVNVLDNWYVVYHRPTNDSKNRQAMMEPINVRLNNGKVEIPIVPMTSQGVEKNGLNPFKRYNAYIACYRTNNAFINSIPRQNDGLNPIQGIEGPSTTIGFYYFNFGQTKISNTDNLYLKLNAEIINSTTIKVFVAQTQSMENTDNCIKIAQIRMNTNTNNELSIPISELDHNNALNKIGELKGKLAVFISFEGKGELCRLKELEFTKENATTPNPLHSIILSTE